MVYLHAPAGRKNEKDTGGPGAVADLLEKI
jgi:hypothetical protein